MPLSARPPELTRAQLMLVLCCRRDPHAVDRSRQLAETVDCRDDVLALAERHGVAPFFLAQHAGHGLPASDAVRQDFQNRLLGYAAQNLALARQLIAIVAMLERNGIPSVNFKGPTLAAAGYGHVGRRSFSDLDVLVPPDRIRDARDLMLAMGFALSDVDHSIFDGVFPAAGSEYALLPAEQRWPAAVEIHARPWKWRMALRLETDALIARRRSVDVAGVMVPALSPEDLVLVLAAHGFQHGWSHLRFITDIDAAAAMSPDWDTVIARARDARAARIVSTAVLAAHTLVGTDAGAALAVAERDSVAVAMAADIARRMFAPEPPLWSGLRKDWVHLRSREHAADKLRFCLRTLALEGMIRPFDRIRHPDWRRRTARGHAPGAAPQ